MCVCVCVCVCVACVCMYYYSIFHQSTVVLLFTISLPLLPGQHTNHSTVPHTAHWRGTSPTHQAETSCWILPVCAAHSGGHRNRAEWDFPLHHPQCNMYINQLVPRDANYLL